MNKARKRVGQIVSTMYHNRPDGLCGNDDCGQMSAWYVFSILGFYPVCPGTTQYAVGKPGVGNAAITLPGGKVLEIRADGLSDRNIYIRSATLNGKKISRPFLDHADLMGGGTIVFTMDSVAK
jgi:putative alpha-1,2-mannosidase